jgi:hypothetical protein
VVSNLPFLPNATQQVYRLLDWEHWVRSVPILTMSIRLHMVPPGSRCLEVLETGQYNGASTDRITSMAEHKTTKTTCDNLNHHWGHDGNQDSLCVRLASGAVSPINRDCNLQHHQGRLLAFFTIWIWGVWNVVLYPVFGTD